MNGYGPDWTEVVPALAGEVAGTLVKHEGEIYAVGEGVGNLVTFTPGDPATFALTQKFTYTDDQVQTSNVISFNSKLWFAVYEGAGQHKIYSWDGVSATPDLEYTTVDGDVVNAMASAAMATDGSDVYVMYTGTITTVIFRVRKYNSGAWHVYALAPSVSGNRAYPRHSCNDGTYWYITGEGEVDAVQSAWIESSIGAGFLTGQGARGSILNSPEVFNGYVYGVAPDPDTANITLFRWNPADGTRVDVDLQAGFGISSAGALVAYDGSLQTMLWKSRPTALSGWNSFFLLESSARIPQEMD